jgi:hypothetical protein
MIAYDVLTRGSDGEGSLNSAKLLVGDKRGVSGVTDVDLAGLQVAADVLAAEAVTSGGDLLDAEGFAHILDGLLDDGVDVVGLVVGQPGGQIGLAGLHVGKRDLVTLEQVRNDGQVAIGGELVGEKLGIGENAEDVGQEEDGLVGALVLGVGDIGVDYQVEVLDVWPLGRVKRMLELFTYHRQHS